MARYVIANRRAGRFSEADKASSRSAVAMAMSSIGSLHVVEDKDPEDPLARRVAVVEAEPAEMQAKAAAMPGDVIIEPEILHYIDGVAPIDLISARPVDPGMMATSGSSFDVGVSGNGQPLEHAKISVFYRGWAGATKVDGVTAANGRATFPVLAGYEVTAAAVVPAGNFWPMIVRGQNVLAPITCPPLPMNGPLGWWHQLAGIGALDVAAGQGIRVGVADTGLARHDCLTSATAVGAFLGGNVNPSTGAAVDLDGHGTHVAGTIGGRPIKAGQYAGVAPGVDLYAARIFPVGGGASNADIANAIDDLSRERQVDLINLSLGAAQPSEIVRDAIIDAQERGTLCIVAAGNSAGAVNYPAAFPEAVAVSALGLAGWGPPGSVSESRLPQQADRHARLNLFLANFSCFGSQIACAAPGVGIVAPVCDPGGTTGFFGAMDGTSMAAPFVTGALAAMLSRDPVYRTLPRDESRATMARNILQASLKDIGLHPFYQGRGAPSLV